MLALFITLTLSSLAGWLLFLWQRDNARVWKSIYEAEDAERRQVVKERDDLKCVAMSAMHKARMARSRAEVLDSLLFVATAELAAAKDQIPTAEVGAL